MAFNPNDNTLAQHFDKLNIKPESKYDEEILDEAIINGMKGAHRAFCLEIETLLNQYMAGQKVPDVIPNLDKYQRKIVHKICDLYNIKRDYVDVKTDETGSITISRTETSYVPTTTLEERYQKHLEKAKKQAPATSSNPFANKKVLIKTRSAQPDKKSASDKNDGKSNGTDNASQTTKSETHDEVEHKKKKEYEQARDRIMQGNTEEKQIVSDNPDPNNPNKVSIKTKKKGRFEGYDPDYDRFRSQQNEGFIMNNNMPIGLAPGMGMPNMYPMGMGGMPMPGMGFYPPQNQPYIPFPGYQMQNPTYPPNMGFPNYGPPPGFQGGNQQPNPAPPTGISGGQGGPGNIGPGIGGGSGSGSGGGYFQNFPTLGRDPNMKNK